MSAQAKQSTATFMSYAWVNVLLVDRSTRSRSEILTRVVFCVCAQAAFTCAIASPLGCTFHARLIAS